MIVAVIGAGKMGLPLACVLASRGATVIASDPNATLVASVNSGVAPFEEPGLAELLGTVVQSGALKATTNNRDAIAASEVCIVIVPVKLDEKKNADLSIIRAVASDIAAALRPGSMVVFETTLPIGETRRLGGIIEVGGLIAGADFDLVFSPERVKSAYVIRNLTVNPKVVGGVNPTAASRAAEFYAKYLGAPVINVESLEAAELVKLAGMVYRDVNIGLANELAWYAESVGVDYATVARAANTDGEAALLSPGIGVGGHCTPVYPYFLIRDAELRGISVELTSLARELNEQQPVRVVERLGDIRGKKVVILGLGFRPDVKEPAYSPAYTLREKLEAAGARVTLNDPLFSESELRAHGFEPGPVDGHEIAILNTAHSAFAALTPEAFSRAGVRILVDGRNVFDAAAVRAAGIEYFGVGRTAPEPSPALVASGS